jgi:hypothetical protein
MLKIGSKSCHFLPLFAACGGRGERRHRAARQISARGSELADAWSGMARKKWQMRAAKWHSSTPWLFTISRGRAGCGNHGGGRWLVEGLAGLSESVFISSIKPQLIDNRFLRSKRRRSVPVIFAGEGEKPNIQNELDPGGWAGRRGGNQESGYKHEQEYEYKQE